MKIKWILEDQIEFAFSPYQAATQKMLLVPPLLTQYVEKKGLLRVTYLLEHGANSFHISPEDQRPVKKLLSDKKTNPETSLLYTIEKSANVKAFYKKAMNMGDLNS
ncbi:MAG TPA: hypothetical protein VHA52_00635 [Candidatus Babeliaceae bacterium]|nr:hypothetical protein [Candidatus Babeliaceae bacterium]